MIWGYGNHRTRARIEVRIILLRLVRLGTREQFSSARQEPEGSEGQDGADGQESGDSGQRFDEMDEPLERAR